jgi:hypothetical protein
MDPTAPANDGSASPLQFDKAEFAQTPSVRSCSRCHQVMGQEYFAAAGAVVCAACARTLTGEGQPKTALLRAAAYGAGAALIGTVIWLLILKISNSEFGLVAIAVGLLVGFAVKKGSGGVGGWKYQAMAMALTYVSITASYVPMVMKGLAEAADQHDAAQKAAAGKPEADPASTPEMKPVAPVAAAAAAPGLGDFALLAAIVFGIAFASPFLSGASNIIGILIIGIALYEAWKLNKRVPVTGPFQFASGPDGGAAPASTSPPSPASPPAP